MGLLPGSGFFVFLIAFVKVEAQKRPPTSVDSRCLGNVLYVDLGLLGGRSLQVAAVLNESSVFLTPRTSSRCGFRIKTSSIGNTVILASLQNCFAQNLGDVDFTTKLNIRVLGDQVVQEEVYQVEKTCRYDSWASREIICNRDYMEVSIRRPTSNDNALPQEAVPGSMKGRFAEKSNRDAEFRVRHLVFFVPEEKPVDVTEAQRKRLITSTATRLFVRSPTPSPETFIEDGLGVSMSMLKTSITFENGRMATRLSAAAACPTLEDGVFFTENSIRWFLPNPLLSSQFELLQVRMGVNGSMLDPSDAAARGFSLTNEEVYIVLEIPFGATGGHVKSYIQDNRYHASYEIEPVLELLWTEGATHDTRYKVFLPITTSPWLQSLYVTDYTVPEKQFFDILLGSFGPDVFLVNISFPTGVLSVEECNARGFNLLEHTFPGRSLKSFSLQIPFEDPHVLQMKEKDTIVFSLHVAFGLLVMPEFTPFSHTATLRAKTSAVASPSITGGCDDDYFYILVKYGAKGFNFLTTVGEQTLTAGLAEEYGLMENGTHLSFSVPFSCPNVVYEAVEETSIRSRVDVTLMDPQTNKSVAQFSLSCTFIKTLTECFPNGTMTALAVKLESVPSLNTSQLVLSDPSCGPAYSNDRYAYFVFTGSSCGTTRKFLSNMMLYENEISLPEELEMAKSTDEPEYELKVYCYYDINETQAVAFNTRARRSEPYADDAKGELKVEIRVASDDTYATFHADLDYPVAKFLQEPVYFEVELKGTKLAAISLELDNCWATLDSDRSSRPRWNLVINGCVNPVDPYKVVFHPVGVDRRVRFPSHFKRFEVRMFAFAEDDESLSHQVFVHCDVVICDAKKTRKGVCDKLCRNEEPGTKSQRRAISEDYILLHVLSGPILINNL